MFGFCLFFGCCSFVYFRFGSFDLLWLLVCVCCVVCLFGYFGFSVCFVRFGCLLYVWLVFACLWWFLLVCVCELVCFDSYC